MGNCSFFEVFSGGCEGILDFEGLLLLVKNEFNLFFGWDISLILPSNEKNKILDEMYARNPFHSRMDLVV